MIPPAEGPTTSIALAGPSETALPRSTRALGQLADEDPNEFPAASRPDTVPIG